MKHNNKKNEIRKIAISLFKEKTFDTVTINDICKASGISKHTFYYYFDSKEDILDRIVEELVDIKNEHMGNIILLDSPYEQFIAFFDLKAKHFIYCGKEIVKKILVARLTKGFELDHDNQQIFQYLVKLVKQAQENKEIANTSDPSIIVRTSMAITIGLLQIWATHPDETFEDLTIAYRRQLDTLLMKQ
ncbi:MAG: TetR/AcrR family transcriptional regulator [Erysipelotrichaceae bacterium]